MPETIQSAGISIDSIEIDHQPEPVISDLDVFDDDESIHHSDIENATEAEMNEPYDAEHVLDEGRDVDLDEDVVAFQNIIAEAKEAEVSMQNPF